MRVATILALVAAGVMACGTGPAQAWGRDEHRIICAMAWDEMPARTRSRIMDILHVPDRVAFAETCNWADHYTAYHKETAGWHYVNVPPDATSIDLQRDCSAAASCAVVQIEHEIESLKSGAPEAAATLRFLAHFVGDLHQPLHVGLAADHGGFDLKGLFFLQPTNLHALWDYGLVDHEGRPWRQIADALRRQITPADRDAWRAAPPIIWGNESLAISRAPETGYRVRGDTFDLDAEYLRANLPIVLLRLKQASVRLARVMEDALP